MIFLFDDFGDRDSECPGEAPLHVFENVSETLPLALNTHLDWDTGVKTALVASNLETRPPYCFSNPSAYFRKVHLPKGFQPPSWLATSSLNASDPPVCLV